MKLNRNLVKVMLHIGFVLLFAAFNIVGMGWIRGIWEEKRGECSRDGRYADGKPKDEREGYVVGIDEDRSDELAVPIMKMLGSHWKVKQGIWAKNTGWEGMGTQGKEEQKKEQAIKTETKQKIAYLTFDDGPSENTDRILDVLKEKGVKATFFVVGKTGEQARARYHRIVEEGHTLGLHSYSHKYEEIYASLDSFKEDVLKLKEYLYEVTGEDMWLYRFPGGSSNSVVKMDIHECIDFLKEEGIVYFDWNASSEDAVEVNASCSVLNSNILKDALRYDHPVILMHDLYECCNTAEGLSSLIDRLLAEGYEIKPITKETKPVQHLKSD